MPKPARRISKQSSPLDAKQRALLEQQQKLAAETHRIEQIISEAPKRRAEIERQRAEQERRHREEILQRNTPYFERFENDLYHTRLNNTTAAPGKRRTHRKPTKSERRAEIIRFIALSILAVGICIVVYLKFIAS